MSILTQNTITKCLYVSENVQAQGYLLNAHLADVTYYKGAFNLYTYPIYLLYENPTPNPTPCFAHLPNFSYREDL